jgi:hypothetical protein
MPDRDVRTLKDLIYYQHAKIIARCTLQAQDGTAAKATHYGFIKQTFRELHKKLFTYLRTSPCSETGKLKGVPKPMLQAVIA